MNTYSILHTFSESNAKNCHETVFYPQNESSEIAFLNFLNDPASINIREVVVIIVQRFYDYPDCIAMSDVRMLFHGPIGLFAKLLAAHNLKADYCNLPANAFSRISKDAIIITPSSKVYHFIYETAYNLKNIPCYINVHNGLIPNPDFNSFIHSGPYRVVDETNSCCGIRFSFEALPDVLANSDLNLGSPYDFFPIPIDWNLYTNSIPELLPSLKVFSMQGFCDSDIGNEIIVYPFDSNSESVIYDLLSKGVCPDPSLQIEAVVNFIHASEYMEPNIDERVYFRGRADSFALVILAIGIADMDKSEETSAFVDNAVTISITPEVYKIIHDFANLNLSVLVNINRYHHRFRSDDDDYFVGPHLLIYRKKTKTRNYTLSFIPLTGAVDFRNIDNHPDCSPTEFPINFDWDNLARFAA